MIPWLLLTALAQDTSRDEPELPEIDVQLFRQSLDAEATLWTNDAGMRPSKYFTVRGGLAYMRDPFVYQWSDGESVSLVKDAFQAHVAGTFHLWRLRLGVDLPVYLFTTSDLANSAAGLGDLLVDLKGTILDHHGKGSFGLALAARTTLPTSTLQVPLGGRTVGYEVEAILDGVAGPMLVAFNVGHRGMGREAFGDSLWNDQLYARLGLGWMARDDGGVSLDLGFASAYHAFFRAETTPVEGMVGGWARLGDALVMRAGVGTGFTPAIGSPLVRALVSFAYEPRWRVFDDPTPLVEAPPPVSAPEPPQPEAPPGPGTLVVTVTDPDGNPVVASVVVTHIRVPSQLELPDRPLVLDAPGGRAESELLPGRVQLKVSADGFATAWIEGTIVSGEVAKFTVPLGDRKAILRDDRIDILEKVLFALDSADIMPDSFELLGQVADIMQEHPRIERLRIEGHTDSRGSDAYNFKLSTDRAEAVLEYLVQQGVARERLVAVGYGERQPLDPRENEEAWNLNRRVAFLIEAWTPAEASAP